MKFALLLKALGLLAGRAAKRNQAFIKYIKPTSVRVLIKTEDGGTARLFIFDKGKVSSQAGNTDNFDVALVWKDASTGFKVLTDRSPDASFRAAARGDLRVEGMSVFAQWFEDAMKMVV